METPKKLYRSRSDRMVFGLCGGLGEYFSIDSTLVRLLFVALAFMGGFGVIAYLFMGIITPEAPVGADDEAQRGARYSSHMGGRVAAGIVLVAFGSLLVMRQFVPLHWISLRLLAPVVLIVLGVYLIFMRRK